MRLSKSELPKGSFVILKDNTWLERQRVAGKVAAKALMALESLVKEKTNLSTLELSRLAEDIIISNKCIPTFKNYKGFPEAVCISVNKQLVHGIPSSYTLKEGDVVSFDLGATFEGAIADSAITCIYGNPIDKNHQTMIDLCKLCLNNGIKAIKIDNRLGCIGYAIDRTAKSKGFQVINNYGGHGLDYNKPHSEPFVENRSEQNKGIRIQRGLSIAIEPMLVPRLTTTSIAQDKWTVMTPEIGCHEEHTIFIHEDKVEIITRRDNENIF